MLIGLRIRNKYLVHIKLSRLMLNNYTPQNKTVTQLQVFVYYPVGIPAKPKPIWILLNILGFLHFEKKTIINTPQ